MTLNDLTVGDVLSYWHDSGASGKISSCDLCFAKILKVSKKKILVIDEHASRPVWKYPHFFLRKVTDPELIKELTFLN